MPKVVVLFHESQRGRRVENSFVDGLAAEWRRRGLEVEFLYGVARRPAADLVVPHVDLTRTPPEYVAFLRTFPRVVNRDLLDISKRVVSRQLVGPQDDVVGPVVLKTDLNYGGKPEERVERVRRPLYARLRRRLVPLVEALLRKPYAFRTTLDEYRVFARASDVPPSARANPALVLERFVPERSGDRFFVRHYVFFGSRWLTSRVGGADPFVKRAHAVGAGRGFPPPPEVLALRSELRADFGKIDYVEHEGRPYVLDVNRTPSLPGSPEADAWVVDVLADGVYEFLPGCRSDPQP